MESERGYDRELWRRLCEQTGLPGLAIPEEYGGVGFGLAELAVACEEMGRALYPSPFLASSVLAATALLASPDESLKQEFLPGIAEGTTLAALALDGEVTASDGTLNGTKTHVIDGAIADLILVVAGGSLYAVTDAVDGADAVRTKLPVLDQTRNQAELVFADTPARLVCADATAALDRVRAVRELALAAESVGGAAKCLEMTVEYAKVREQFGRPIGSFQAYKHRCADLYVELEAAKSTVYYAAWAMETGDSEAAVLAPLAMHAAVAAYRHIAEETIQLHGGVGFTWEHDAHLYLKRAISTALLFENATAQRERIAAFAGI
jgi:alkylation response protein AidB-like acyl-CoA dehydrogenase